VGIGSGIGNAASEGQESEIGQPMARILVESRERLGDALARDLERRAGAAIAARGRFSLALPGGSVAEAFLPVLSRAAIDWSRVDLFFGDERAVPPEHSDSNFALAKRLLLDPVAARVHRLRGESEDLGAEASRAEHDLVETAGPDGALDVALLGVGPDGHVCSLFPGHPALRENARLIAVVEDSPKPPPRRITLTLPALRRARCVAVAAFGAAKADVVAEAVGNPDSTLPVALVVRQARDAWLLLDPAAAAGLR